MPKKFQGENSKSAAARARKDAQKADEQQRKAQAEEDERWRDDDKHAAKKQARKADKETKLQERSDRRAELRALHDQEMAAAAPKSDMPEKVTRAEIEARREAAARGAGGGGGAVQGVEPQPELEENLNRLAVDGEQARTVDEALDLLGGGGGAGADSSTDRHPERRMRAAYTAFEERELARLKRELPGMRLSQLKQLVHKAWEKAPENPMNQRRQAYNSK